MTATEAPEVADGAEPDETGSVVGRRVRGAGSDLLRKLVVDDLRSGVIRLGGLGAPMQVIAVTAMVALAVGMGLVVANESVRNHAQLVLISASGRGLLVPRFLIPTASMLLALGAALVLAGALHCPVWARAGALVAYLGVADAVRRGSTFADSYTSTDRWIGVAALVAVVVVFAVRWRARPAPVPEFLALFACTAVTFIDIQQAMVTTRGSEDFGVFQLNDALRSTAILAAPLLVVAGIGVVTFMAATSRWTVDFLEDRVHPVAVYVVLVALGLWRLHDVVLAVGHAIAAAPGAAVTAYAKGALVFVLFGAGYVAVDRIADARTGQETEDADIEKIVARAALPIAGLLLGIDVALGVVLLVSRLVGSVVPGNGTFDGPVIRTMTWWSDGNRSTDWLVIVGIAAIAGAIAWARVGSRSLALFAMVFGIFITTQELAESSHWFAFLGVEYGGLDLWWTLLLVATTARWLVRKELDAHRAARMLFLFVLTALFLQQDFASNPLAVLLRLSGVGLVVFGLVWGFLTSGSWCNSDTSRLSRESRIMVFLGYQLFAITLLSWFTITHDLVWRDGLTSARPEFGLELIGGPFLIALAIAVFAGAVSDRRFETDDDVDDETDEAAQPEPAPRTPADTQV